MLSLPQALKLLPVALLGLWLVVLADPVVLWLDLSEYRILLWLDQQQSLIMFFVVMPVLQVVRAVEHIVKDSVFG